MKNIRNAALLAQSSLVLAILGFLVSPVVSANEEEALAVVPPDARELVRAAWEYWRGQSSENTMEMIIHRPDWERSMTMQGWTKGEKKSLVRVLEPKKDRGNGTLMDDNSMWSYSPKVNRVIKVPSSMMGQSWMGSDFSNKDITRADDIVEMYEHSLLSEDTSDGFKVYVIESVPREDAAVVWGKEVISVREDMIVLLHQFYDQDGELVKQQRTLEIKELGGRLTATVQRMEKLAEPDEWTEVRVLDVAYDVDLSDNIFTLSNLRNPRN